MGLTVGSVFAGIGGFDLGFERAGMKVIWNCEIDDRCRRVLQRHWPGIPRFKNVETITGAGLGAAGLRPDVLAGGFPCQGLSVAGARGGLDDPRSRLFFEFARLAEELRPPWVVVENVPGLLSSAGGRDMGTVLATLVDLGYGVAWRVLDAQYFRVAQRRRRVFIVGCLGDGARAEQVLLEPEGGGGDPPARRAAGQEPAGAAAPGSRRRGYAVNGGADCASTFGTNCASTFGTNAQGGLRTTDLDSVEAYIVEPTVVQEVANALGTRDGKGTPASNASSVTLIPTLDPAPCLQEREGKGQDSDGTRAMVAYSIYPESGQGADLRATECDISPAISATDGGKASEWGVRIVQEMLGAEVETVAYQCHGTNVGEMGTLRQGNGGVTGGVPFTVTTLAVRRLLPVECCRLQGFPDDWLDGLGLPDSAKYRMLGNAVAVPVVEWLGRRLSSSAGGAG